MDQNRLRWLLQNMEDEAQKALSRDVSFIEALQALKRAVDRDSRVKSLTGALRDRGVSVSGSFVPRVRIRFYAGEIALDLPQGDALVHTSVNEPTDEPGDPLPPSFLDRLRAAAGAVIADSPYGRKLETIVNEAVQASSSFEQLAAVVEQAGYDVQIWLDFSTYPELRAQRSPRPPRASAAPIPEPTRPTRPTSDLRHHGRRERARASHPLPLSGADLLFLKKLQISPE